MHKKEAHRRARDDRFSVHAWDDLEFIRASRTIRRESLTEIIGPAAVRVIVAIPFVIVSDGTIIETGADILCSGLQVREIDLGMRP